MSISLKRTAKIAVIFYLLFLAGCRTPPEQAAPYLILYAFDAEGQVLMEKMSITEDQKLLGRAAHVGKLAGVDIVLAESGMGMTNAAMTSQKLIDEFQPRGVIFTGIAGAIDNAVHIGDIVVCENWVTHDYVYHGAGGLQPEEVWVYSPDLDSVIGTFYFSVDSLMYEIVERLTEDVLPFQAIGQRPPKLITGGVGVSGNAFVDNLEKRNWLSTTFNALITDMESAAVAQVCAVNDVPFISLRSASDLAGGSGSESAEEELREFSKVAATNSSVLVIKLLESL